jgi:hypothetical protein
MGKQQTAVEWLINEIKIARKLCDDLSMEMDIWHTLDVLIAKEEQAKEMEKEQIINAYRTGCEKTIVYEIEKQENDDAKRLTSKGYYNETFKNK